MSSNTVADTCSNCSADAKCRRRDFSAQAWTVLLVWGEVQAGAVDQAICDDCYDDLRDTLIDRAEDIEAALSESGTKAPSRGTTTAPGKVRKAG